MTTPIDRHQIDAFVDGELDLNSQLEMERRLKEDSALRKQVDELRQLKEVVRESATYHAAPDALRQRMAALMPRAQSAPEATNATNPTAASAPMSSPAKARPAQASSVFDTVQRWLAWRPLAASLSFAAVAAVAVNVLWLQSYREDRLSDDVVASHVRATLGQHMVDVSSSDHHTVKPFLSSKLGFSPPVDELQIPGSVFLGGRVDYLDGRPVAALVYKQGEHVVDSFVWPSKSSDSKPTFAAERGYLTAHWVRNGMSHWVISDVNREEFQAVVDAIARTEVDR